MYVCVYVLNLSQSAMVLTDEINLTGIKSYLNSGEMPSQKKEIILNIKILIE